MNVCVECGTLQNLGQACNHCGGQVMLPLAFVQDVFGPKWRQMFRREDVPAAPRKKMSISINLPDGVVTSTWQSTGVPR